MIALSIIDIKKKVVNIVKKDRSTTIKILQTIIHNPTSQRFIRIGMYKCINESEDTEGLIDYLYSQQIPTLNELFEWEDYPIHIVRRN